MTDIYPRAAVRAHIAGDPVPPQGNGLAIGRSELVAFVELLFFAYRDFTGEADAVLAEFGFGRAHHRVLHFVHRHPGIRVADLLEILKITKQSAARVLKELIAKGYIEQRAGREDRRERLLFATARGARLAGQLCDLQTARIGRALAEAGPDAAIGARKFLAGIISGPERDSIERLISAGSGPGNTEGGNDQ